MIVMRHDIGILWPGNQSDLHHIDLVVYGEQHKTGGFSAMAKTVGYPVAFASAMILKGRFDTRLIGSQIWNLKHLLM